VQKPAEFSQQESTSLDVCWRSMMFREASLLLEKILAKFLRSLPSNLLSKKRISQFFFLDLVSQIRKSHKRDDILYVKSDSLSQFLSQGVPNQTVILAGGTDHDITKAEYEAMNTFSSTTFFVQNLDFPETSNVFFLPIGVEDLRWGKNGMTWNFRKKLATRVKSKKILIGPFGNTHQVRSDCLRAGMSSKASQVLLERLPSWRYSSIASRYLFVACPRGNGLDTHRFWETLYRGSVPVVKDSAHSSNLRRYQIPHVSIRAWDSHDLDQIIDQVELGASQYDFLNPEWWRHRILCSLGLEK